MRAVYILLVSEVKLSIPIINAGETESANDATLIPQSTATFVGLRGSLIEFISNQRGEVIHVFVDNGFKVPRVAQEK